MSVFSLHQMSKDSKGGGKKKVLVSLKVTVYLSIIRLGEKKNEEPTIAGRRVFQGLASVRKQEKK